MTVILTLPGVKTDLNIPSSTSDTAIESAIDATTAAIESQTMCGPFSSQTYTETLSGCGTIVLTRGPVIGLTSVSGEIFGPIETSLLAVNDSGVVRPKRMQVLLFDDYYTVEYTYGRTDDVPEPVKQAALVICKSLLTIRKGSGTARPGTGGTDTVTVPGVAFPVPVLAMQMLEPYLRGPSVG